MMTLLLATFAYLSPKNIEEELANKIAKQICGDTADSTNYIALFHGLKVHSILNKNEKESYYHINSFLHEYLKNKYLKEGFVKWGKLVMPIAIGALTEILIETYEYDAPLMRATTKGAEVLIHVEAFIENITSIKQDFHSEKLCELCYIAAHLACYNSSYEKALKWYVLAEKTLPESQIQLKYRIAHAKSQVYLLRRENYQDYEKAKNELKQSEKIMCSLAKKSYIDYIMILNDLARLNYDTGDYHESIHICNTVISFFSAIKLPENSLAYVQHDIGMAYFSLNMIEEAKLFFTSSLAYKIAVFGEIDIPTIATTRLSLGQTDYYEDNLSEAEIKFISSLEMSKRCYPIEHYPLLSTGIAAAYNDIACCKARNDNAADSLSNYHSSLKIYMNLSNNEINADSAIVIYNLSIIINILGDQEFSEKLIQHAYDGCKTFVGEQHIITKKIKIIHDIFTKSNRYDGNIEEIMAELDSKIMFLHGSIGSKIQFLKENLILSQRYAFFMSENSRFLFRNQRSDQLSYNLVLSTR